jgi:ParB family chromosome partitioning protein
VSRRSGLGKGIGALIPSETATAVAAPTDGLQEIAVSAISPNRHQPRQVFDEESLNALSESVRALGVLQPVLVRPMSQGQFELIAGERRWRAARRAGLSTIPAVVREVADMVALEHAVVENLHRQDLNPLEEAAAYQHLIDDFGLTQEQTAQRVGKSRTSITNLLRLFQLPPAVQRLLSDGEITLGHAKVLLSTPDRPYQEALARRIVSDELTVRAVETLIREREELESNLASDPDPRQTGKPASPAKLRPPGLLELEELLSGRLDTTVKVEMRSKRGRVTIDFANLEDLERIYRLINPSG